MHRRAGAAAVALWACSVAPAAAKVRIATFAAGCFRCAEAPFAGVAGVVGREVGCVPAPDAQGGHPVRLEAIRPRYDDEVTSCRRLLAHFLLAVDPSDAGGQFCERGPQNRTAVVAAGPEERATAKAALELEREP